MVTYQLQVERRTGKESWPETDVLPLSHADQLIDKSGDFVHLFTNLNVMRISRLVSLSPVLIGGRFCSDIMN